MRTRSLYWVGTSAPRQSQTVARDAAAGEAQYPPGRGAARPASCHGPDPGPQLGTVLAHVDPAKADQEPWLDALVRQLLLGGRGKEARQVGVLAGQLETVKGGGITVQ